MGIGVFPNYRLVIFLPIGDLQKLIHDLCDHGIGILITDHNVRETLGICDRAYIVNNGKILAEGTSEQILNNKKALIEFITFDHYL